MKNLLKDITLLASHFDSKGNSKAANLLDGVLAKYAGMEDDDEQEKMIDELVSLLEKNKGKESPRGHDRYEREGGKMDYMEDPRSWSEEYDADDPTPTSPGRPDKKQCKCPMNPTTGHWDHKENCPYNPDKEMNAKDLCADCGSVKDLKHDCGDGAMALDDLDNYFK